MRSELDSYFPEWVKFGNFGTLHIYTENIPESLETISSHPFWRRWHNLGIGVTVTAMVSLVIFLAFFAVQTFTHNPEPTAANKPSNFLLIPGVNDFFPIRALGYIFIAVAIGIAIHELGHAIASLNEGIDVEELGLVFFFGVPLGAYVKPSPELDDLPLVPFARVLSAGVMNNFAISVLCYLYFVFHPLGVGTVFASYFGQILGLGLDVPAVSSLGAATKLMFWMFFLNINLAITNALPVAILDGGQILGRTVSSVDSLFGFDVSDSLRFAVIVGAYAFSMFVLLIVLIGPYFL